MDTRTTFGLPPDSVVSDREGQSWTGDIMEMTNPVPKFAMDFYFDGNHVDYVGDIVTTSDQRFLVE